MSQRSQRQCPRCRLPLHVGQTANVSVHACGQCGGLWLDRADADRMVHSLCEHALQLAESAASHALAKVDTDAEGIPCPVCQHPLARSRVDKAWLDIDVCSSHGTWFDRGELQRVARSLGRPQAADWRDQPPPAQHPAAGAAAATAATVGTAGVAAGVATQLGQIAEQNPIATEVAADLAIEGTFSIAAAIFEALLD